MRHVAVAWLGRFEQLRRTKGGSGFDGPHRGRCTAALFVFALIFAPVVSNVAAVIAFSNDARAEEPAPPPKPKFTCRTPEVELRIRDLQELIKDDEQYLIPLQEDLAAAKEAWSSAEKQERALPLRDPQHYLAEVAARNAYDKLAKAQQKVNKVKAEIEAARKELFELEWLPSCKEKKTGTTAPTPRPTEQVASTFGGGLYTGVGTGMLASVCPNWTTTGVDSLHSNDKVGADNSGCYSSGFLVSAYVGYEWTFASRWLAGIEGDFGYATNKATTGVPGVSSAPGDSVSVKEDWNGGIRARVGYAVAPNTIVYGTAGLALQHISATVTCSSAAPFPCGRFGPVTAMTATNAPVLAGGTVGVGVEYAITGNLRLRGEYRFSDYPSFNATYGNPANVAVSSSIQLRTNTALLGLTYEFGASSLPAPLSPPPLITK